MATKNKLEKDKSQLLATINDLTVRMRGIEAMLDDTTSNEQTKKDLNITLNSIKSQISEKENLKEKIELELEEKFIKNKLTTNQSVAKTLESLNAYYI